MIGARRRATALVGILGLAVLLRGGPGPAAVIHAEHLLAERTAAADAKLADLQAALEPALDAARAGAARVVGGDEPPGERLASAAELLRAADTAAATAAAAVAGVEGARRVLGRPPVAVASPVGRAELSSIAAQLEASADAAGDFAEMRRRAERVVVTLAAALEAVADAERSRAERLAEQARSDLEALAAWDVELATLPVWLDAANALLAITEDLATAASTAEVEAAARDLEALREDATQADRALRIAMGEGGAAVTAAPLGRLADVLRRVADARARLALILQAVRR